ncbi:hypothetical protein SAMN02745172_03740 [Pseudoxanthobacter soli DSM 19599]|uniref:DUF1398 domain-containing protein n=1 Tax=Pseudoxanthobacter soli DSM 19599 TaxID=1123029 RepID=A0A1M7ZQZ7_9HYPH|nr:DUF1398 domain-containing protein [Pseudoxanthobacter soli]SHO67076.1 hypothetical protein SAMN02745172_03740 [Pseudoxanthobacter soli DSM 19599]
MDAERIAIARSCLDAAHDGTESFPTIVGRLIAAGFEGYAVDYRRNTQLYYLPDGDGVELPMPPSPGGAAPEFDADRVAALVRWAQANGPDYSYAGFCTRAKAAGCAGYLVSFPGRRVLYYGRTAETHVEHFPR